MQGMSEGRDSGQWPGASRSRVVVLTPRVSGCARHRLVLVGRRCRRYRRVSAQMQALRTATKIWQWGQMCVNRGMRRASGAAGSQLSNARCGVV